MNVARWHPKRCGGENEHTGHECSDMFLLLAKYSSRVKLPDRVLRSATSFAQSGPASSPSLHLSEPGNGQLSDQLTTCLSLVLALC